MKKKLNLGSGCVIENMSVAKDHFILSLLLTSTCDDALPGQFVMIRKQGVKDPLLSRPLSLYGVYQTEAGTVLEFLYRVVVKGTWALSRLTGGDQVDILGPLGKPFEIVPERNHVILLAGGIGVAPLSYFAEFLAKDFDRPGEKKESLPSSRKVSFYLGAITAAALVGLEKIARFCTEVCISTDDGSSGFAGTITDLLQKDLAGLDHQNLCLYSCGPTAMIRSLSRLIEDFDIPCQVSMEERMACGIGACLGCSIKVRDASDGWAYCQVCTEGPVFNIKDLLWE